MAQAGSAALRGLVWALAVAPLVLGGTVSWSAPTFRLVRDAELAAAIERLQDGDVQGALATLDACARRLDTTGPRREAAVAHLFLGVAHAELDREAAGAAEFRRALELDPSLELRPERFSERAFFLFKRQKSGRLLDVGDYQSRDHQLTAAIQQLNAGDYETAAISLDACVRRLMEKGDRRDLASAYLHLGIAYVGLDHESAGSNKFRQALRVEPGLNVDASRYSARIVRLFQMEQLQTQLAANKARGKAWRLAGGGAAVGGTIAASSLTSNKGPVVKRISINPSVGLQGVTSIELGAQALDLEHDALGYRWDLGDGNTATGQTIRHTYAEAGSYSVDVTVDDGHGNEDSGTSFLHIGTLNGSYRVAVGGEVLPFTCAQAGQSLHCVASERSANSPHTIEGTLNHPFLVQLSIYRTRAGGPEVQSCFGEATPPAGFGAGPEAGSSLQLQVSCGPVELDPQ